MGYFIDCRFPVDIDYARRLGSCLGIRS